jgi:uncharacterized protein
MNTTDARIDSRLLDILVCPICKGSLKRGTFQTSSDSASPSEHATISELVCGVDQLAFPIRDGIARMLVDEARAL